MLSQYIQPEGNEYCIHQRKQGQDAFKTGKGEQHFWPLAQPPQADQQIQRTIKHQGIGNPPPQFCMCKTGNHRALFTERFQHALGNGFRGKAKMCVKLFCGSRRTKTIQPDKESVFAQPAFPTETIGSFYGHAQRARFA